MKRLMWWLRWNTPSILWFDMEIIPYGINPWHRNWKWAFKPCFEFKDFGSVKSLHLCLFDIIFATKD